MESTDLHTMRNRRRTIRYGAKKDAKAVLGGREGEIVDVSTGGIGFRFEGDFIPHNVDQVIDIALNSDAFFLSGVPVESIVHCVVEEEVVGGASPAKRCGIVFGNLKPHQRFQLDYFIWLNSHATA